MTRRVSPIFIVAGVVVGLSCFVLLSMLFYSPADYFERANEVASSSGGGFRFSVAAMFFKPFGIGAFIGWAIVLLWAVIVFFKETVGDLALRAVSLAVVVVSGASVAQLLGTGHLGGHLGYTFGTFLNAAFGSTLGVIVMGAIFAVSFLLATDFGFVTYFREARAALAEPDEETVPDENDLVSIIERTAREVEEEAVAVDVEPETELLLPAPPEPELPPEVIQQSEEEPLLLNLRPKIEEEALDEDLLVAERPAEPREVIRDRGRAMDIDSEFSAGLETEEEESRTEALAAATAALEALLAQKEAEDAAGAIAEAPELDIEIEEEPVAAEEAPILEPRARDALRDLDSVFDALVGLREPEPVVEEEAVAEAEPEPEVEIAPEPVYVAPTFVLDDEIFFGGEAATAEPEPEAAAAPATVAPVAIEEEEAAPAPAILLDDSIPTAAEEPADRMLPFMDEEEEAAPATAIAPEIAPEPVIEEEIEEEIPVLEDVAEPEPAEEKSGLFGSLFKRKKAEVRLDRDPLLGEAAGLVMERGRASVVLLQRRLDIGYTRASRLVEAMEREGLVGPLEESGSREVRMTAEEWEAHLAG